MTPRILVSWRRLGGSYTLLGAWQHEVIQKSLIVIQLGGGFKHFLCSPRLGEMIQFDYILFSNGLKPPTRQCFFDVCFLYVMNPLTPTKSTPLRSTYRSEWLFLPTTKQGCFIPASFRHEHVVALDASWSFCQTLKTWDMFLIVSSSMIFLVVVPPFVHVFRASRWASSPSVSKTCSCISLSIWNKRFKLQSFQAVRLAPFPAMFFYT